MNLIASDRKGFRQPSVPWREPTNAGEVGKMCLKSSQVLLIACWEENRTKMIFSLESCVGVSAHFVL